MCLRLRPVLRSPELGGSIWSAVCALTRRHRVKRISVIALALAAGIGVADASAQQRQITGQVTSASGEAVAGANVSITGTAFAAVTNAEGRYAIPAPAGAVTLVVRRIAFKRKEVAVPADQSQADVTLEADVFNLEAVVVTGQATGVERSEEHTS